MSSVLAVEDGAFVVQDGALVTESAYDGGSGSGGGGDSPQTIPTQLPADRAAQAGLTINTTKIVTSTSEITGEPNTLYIIDGNSQTSTPTVMTDGGNPNTLYKTDGGSQDPFTWDGPMDLGTIDDTAICGVNDASIPIPAGYRDYALTTTGGTGFLWSGIDLDQTASNAFGRLNTKVDDNGTVEFVKTIGSGRRTSGSYPSAGLQALHPAALTSGGTTTVRNVELIQGGEMADSHTGHRPVGIFMDGQHKGTLNIARTRIEEFPNNALYATATNGTVNSTDCRYFNNGVTNGRVSFGEFTNCTIGFDYTNTGMANARPADHACNGISVDDKGNGTNVDVTNCSIYMHNVEKCAGGINVPPFGDGGHFGTIKDCDIHINNAANASDVNIGHTNGSVDTITNCVFSGSADGGASITNNGPTVAVSGNSFDYAAGRQKYSGPIS